MFNSISKYNQTTSLVYEDPIVAIQKQQTLKYKAVFAQTDVSLSHSGEGLFAYVSVHSSCAILRDQHEIPASVVGGRAPQSEPNFSTSHILFSKHFETHQLVKIVCGHPRIAVARLI